MQVTVKLLKEYNVVSQDYSPPTPQTLPSDERKVHKKSYHNFGIMMYIIYDSVFCMSDTACEICKRF